MSKVAVVYWSGTGNTEAMANAVADGIQSKGAEAVMLGPSDFTKDMVAEYDAIPARRSRSSALTAGATASGCASGKMKPVMQALFWQWTA